MGSRAKDEPTKYNIVVDGEDGGRQERRRLPKSWYQINPNCTSNTLTWNKDLAVMTTKTQARWGILLLLCYGATLIQLHLIHKQDNPNMQSKRHHRLQATRTMAEFSQRRRRKRHSRTAHHNKTIPSYKNGHHIHFCNNSQGRRVRLPRVPDFIIGGEYQLPVGS